jgi:acyl carrier protein
LSDENPLHVEIKELIVETLVLEDVTAAEIETDAPLFSDGLGLDSIDSLEIAMVLEERYGAMLADDPDANREIFHNVRSLGQFVSENRTK